MLRCGLVASETLIGWTVIGKVPRKGDYPSKSDNNITQQTTFGQPSRDPFLQTVTFNDNGRYEV